MYNPILGYGEGHTVWRHEEHVGRYEHAGETGRQTMREGASTGSKSAAKAKRLASGELGQCWGSITQLQLRESKSGECNENVKTDARAASHTRAHVNSLQAWNEGRRARLEALQQARQRELEQAELGRAAALHHRKASPKAANELASRLSQYHVRELVPPEPEPVRHKKRLSRGAEQRLASRL
jgi:hypothetical protein